MKARLVLLSMVLSGAVVAPSDNVSAKPQVLVKCPTAQFLNLARSKGAGDGYVKPSQKVVCTATEVEVTSNNMISYPFESKTPHQLLPQNLAVKFPRIPVLASSPTRIVNRLGTLGITTSGLLVYGATEGPVPTESAYGDPYYNKMLDNCGGHAGPQSEYHLHVLITIAICNLKKTGIIGYAIDGFPIYGPTGCLNLKCTKTALVKSGYVLTGDPKKNVWDAYKYSATPSSTILDECNGRIQPDGTYGYHATLSFPYILGCLRGTPTTQTGAAAAPMDMGGGAGPKPGGPQPGGPPPGGPPPGGPPPSTIKSNSVGLQLSGNENSIYCILNWY